MVVENKMTAAESRKAEAARYRPAKIRLLLVAEGPPLDPSRYSHFESVTAQESHFRYICLGLYGIRPGRGDKDRWLSRPRDDGPFLFDQALEWRTRGAQ